MSFKDILHKNVTYHLQMVHICVERNIHEWNVILMLDQLGMQNMSDIQVF